MASIVDLGHYAPVGSGTNDTTVVAVTPISSTEKGVVAVMLQAFTQNVRYTLDGTDPTNAVGFQLKAGDPPVILPITPGSTGQTVRVIQEAANAVIQYQFLKLASHWNR